MNLKFSCIIDTVPIFKTQAFIFVTSLIEQKIEPENIFIHTIEYVEDDFFLWLQELGVNIIKVEPFDSRNKYCNKLVQLEIFQNLKDFDYVFLMDCDTAIVSLEGLNFENDVYAKIVDFPNPPEEILKKIYKEADIDFVETNATFSIENSKITAHNNCNGGLYIFSKEGLNEVAPLWIHYAKWCIDNATLFTEKYSKHADQVGFALAMTKLNKQVSYLGIEWNFPIHLDSEIIPNIEPRVIHFHGKLDNHMNLLKVGLSDVDMKIDLINKIINDSLSKKLNNKLFWNNRYSLYPKLGSGIGSRGDILEYKRKLLKYSTYPFTQKSVVDVGCGDLETTRLIPFKNYLGLDLSGEALKIARKKRPDWKFSENEIQDDSVDAAELILCFDVLIHQSDRMKYDSLFEKIITKAKERLIIGAYNDQPKFSSDITYHYSNILEEVKKHNKFNEISIIGKYRDITVVCATVNNVTHQRDISSNDLNIAFNEVKRPDLLQYIVDVSRSNFHFFTSHYPRVFEYTWLMEQIENEGGKSILDLGAGVCPLPLCLADLNMNVTTVDSHSKRRKIDSIANWNEWGYLDYSIFNKKIKSFNLKFEKFRSFKKFDFIYSISVIEHIKKRDRIILLKRAARLLKGKGKLLLTIDLIPETNCLWNLSECKEVESTSEHGNIDSFKLELEEVGFEILEDFIQRGIKDSRTDLYYVKAILKRSNWFNF